MEVDLSTRVALSVSEACIAANVGRTRIYEEISAGRLRVVKVGRRTLVPVDALRDWIKLLQAGAASLILVILLLSESCGFATSPRPECVLFAEHGNPRLESKTSLRRKLSVNEPSSSWKSAETAAPRRVAVIKTGYVLVRVSRQHQTSTSDIGQRL